MKENITLTGKLCCTTELAPQSATTSISDTLVQQPDSDFDSALATSDLLSNNSDDQGYSRISEGSNIEQAEDYWAHRIRITQEAINWDKLVAVALDVRGTGTSIELGALHSGAFNIVRELKFNDGLTWVARIPKLSAGGSPHEGDEQKWVVQDWVAGQMLVEVASLRYVRRSTDIPVPEVFHWTTNKGGDGVGLPFTLESFLPGVRLREIWEDLSDDARSAFYKQVAHIYLELSYKCRLPKIGSPYMSAHRSTDLVLHTDEEFAIGPFFYPGNTGGGPYDTGFECLMDGATESLESIRRTTFGDHSNSTVYCTRWILRSLLPHVYDATHAAMDAKGFALTSNDLHIQNILVEIGPTGQLVITGVLDWDLSSTLPNTQFAKFPFFLMDNPMWPLDDPRRERIWADQEVFITHLRAEEESIDPSTPLTNAMFNNRLAQLIDEAIQDVAPNVENQIWARLFGEDGGKDLAWSMVSGLEEGLLEKRRVEFKKDVEVQARLFAAFPNAGEDVRRPLTAWEWLDMIKDKPELAEERKYLDELLAS